MRHQASGNADRLRIAMIGTRGVPASYGGFETAVDEIGRRLAARGHEITVYCRNQTGEKRDEYLGMRLVYRPALRRKSLETLSHTALSVTHALGNRPDAAFVFNAANAPFVPLLHTRRIPTAVHVDGLEWMRGKWGRVGRQYYRAAESIAVRSADALIADAQGIADYYSDEFGVPTELLTYGAPIQRTPGRDRLAELGLEPRGYHLVVARFEPENHVDMIVEGYSMSDARLPLVVVGTAPYSAEYTNAIERMASVDDRVRLLGGVWDQELLDQLYANALSYLHGHSVGGTNPSLLRAMGAGTSVTAFDVVFNREVLGDDGRYFRDEDEAGRAILASEASAEQAVAAGERLRDRAEERYNWDAVASGYEALARRLAARSTVRSKRARRTENSAWTPAMTSVEVADRV
ncbi:DUF1972 domain-containing protein [Leifsonia sp. NPDC080035]|uniref:DUF1972 domain-containing protein n=1 Tax=Leifsonia sp. NPDC080035 TaxID=3143936 RepID=A0AAU7GFA4_9MICO